MNNNDSSSKKLVNLLIKNRLTIGTAESLSGGMLASTICGVPGASKVFLEGIVSYSVNSKKLRLGVSQSTLEKYTSVSNNCAVEMAIGVKNFINADIGISTTGVAGPEEFDADGNPRGLFYIAIAFKDICKGYEFKVDLNREETRKFVTEKAIELLIDLVEKGENYEND